MAGPVTVPWISGWIPWMPDRPPAAIAAQAARASADEPAPKAAFTDRWLEPTSTAFGAPVQIVPQETPQASASGPEVEHELFGNSHLRARPDDEDAAMAA